MFKDQRIRVIQGFTRSTLDLPCRGVSNPVAVVTKVPSSVDVPWRVPVNVVFTMQPHAGSR